ncbi:SulP family inorganic anion transporter [Pelagibius marinus]|uniref:SulP family inorganic anion transporter n=1 Tax=Pelagibius marinus TaxID=2762760 RepID=UPI0029CA287F|nr:SulP family inorganic anion transporter [Pelagibius marinus]
MTDGSPAPGSLPPDPPASGPAWRLFKPKLITVLKEGYGWGHLRADAVAGLTVAVVALPLAMALAIASGAPPDKGLVTAVVAGFLISLLGGSRFQIGGPTGAFVVVVFNVIAQHGYDGLLLATLMAGAMLVVAGLLRFGTWIKYIPEPVVTGFTAGIAVIIFSSQLKDLFGLSLAEVPAEFLPKLKALWAARDTLDPATFAVAATALAAILLLRRYAPKVPALLVAVVGASLAVWGLGLPVETIGSRFGEISSSLPLPQLPAFSLRQAVEVLPSAFTIAFLAGIESLLSAMVADGMTGARHRSNCELVAQGVANAASACFAGLPATGAIARTATNIRSGARSPISGMLHAVFLLVFMLVAAPLAAYVPLASLAAVLVIVAWNMSEIDKFRHLMSAPPGDAVVLLVTFSLTVMVDLTVAIEVGVVMAAVLFMHRMAQVVQVEKGVGFLQGDVDDAQIPALDYAFQTLPAGVEMFSLRGPLFFGAARSLRDALEAMPVPPKVFILRMRNVPMIDSSGVAALSDFMRRCRDRGVAVIVSGIRPQPKDVLSRMGFGTEAGGRHDNLSFAANFAEAREMAAAMIEERAAE